MGASAGNWEGANAHLAFQGLPVRQRGRERGGEGGGRRGKGRARRKVRDGRIKERTKRET